MPTPKATRIDLGLAILSATAKPGREYTQREIAAYAGCSRPAIALIEKMALAKCRKIIEHRDTQLKFRE